MRRNLVPGVRFELTESPPSEGGAFANLTIRAYPERDLNSHCLRSKRSDSCQLVYRGMVRRAGLELALTTFSTLRLCQVGLPAHKTGCQRTVGGRSENRTHAFSDLQSDAFPSWLSGLWCGWPGSNRQARRFELRRYANSHHIRTKQKPSNFGGL